MGELDVPDLNAPKRPAIPRFRVEAVHQPFRSQQEGKPCFEDQEFVDILIPGDRRSMASERVNDEHKTRWPAEYRAFKEGRELPLDGTPLANWPNGLMTRSRVEELVYFHIRTVEDLAGVDDAKLVNIGMGGRELREAARKFLDVAKNGTGPLEKLVTENFRLKDEVARLTAVIAEQGQTIDALRAQLKEHAHAH